MENFQEQSHESWNEHEIKTKDQQRYKLENTVAQTWSSESTRQLLIKFSLRSAPRLEYLWDSPTGRREVREAQLSAWTSMNEYQLKYVALQERQWRATGVQILQEIFMEYDRDRSGVAGLSMAQLCSTALIWSCAEWSLQCLSMCTGTTDPRGIQLKKSRGFGSWRVSRLAKRFQSRLGCSNYDAATNLNERHLSKVCFVKTANFKKVSTLSILSSIISYT